MTPLLAKSTAEQDKPALSARSSTPLPAPGSKEGVIMYMPAGVHVIHAGLGPKSKAIVWVKVDREGAAALQASFLQMSEALAPLKAFFDREHEGKDATAWPTEFFWSESPAPGIYARCEFSELGRHLIEGKIQRGFSGQFFSEAQDHLPLKADLKAGQTYRVPEGKPGSQTNPARLTRIDFPIAGGMTNFPAFVTNLPLWAKNAGASSFTTPTPNNAAPMKKTKAQLEAEIQQCNRDIAEISARDQSLAENIEALTARNQHLELLNVSMEAVSAQEAAAVAQQALTARNAADAQAAVALAVKRGAIGPKDEALQQFWIGELTQDPTKAAHLAKMKGSVTLSGITGVTPDNTPSPVLVAHRGVMIERSNPEGYLNNIASLTAKSHGLLRKDDYKSQLEIGREIGACYSERIKPFIDAKEFAALKASNQLGTLAETLVATRTLENLVLSLPLLSRCGSSFSDQIVSYGDILKTRFVLAPSVVTYNTTTGWADSDDVTTDVSITYDKYKGCQIMLTAQDIAGSSRRLFDEIAPMQAYALGKQIVDDLYAVITYAAFSGETNLAGATAAERSVGLGSFGRSTLVDLSGDLDDNGNPDMGRFCLLARPYWSALKKDNTIIQLAVFNRPEIIEKGVIRDIEDFDIIKAVNLPATSINGKTLKGFAGTKGSLLYATRLSADYVNANPGAGNGILQVITLGDTGISANLVAYVDNKLGRAYRRLEIIYGVAAGRELAGQLLTDV